MDQTTHLGLPYIQAAQAQKHVTHNEALQLLRAVVQLSVLDRAHGAQPAAPTEGARLHCGGTSSSVSDASGGPTIACSSGAAWKVVAALGATVA